MPNDIFTFDDLPESSGSNLEEGTHVLTITNLEQVMSKTGSLMAQFSYTIDNNANLKLNYDNCPLKDKDGNSIPFGGNKLKKIIKATEVNVTQFTISTLKSLLVGKSFQVKLTKNDKGYLVIDASNIDTIKAVEPETLDKIALKKSTQPHKNEEVKLNLETESVNLEDEDNW